MRIRLRVASFISFSRIFLSFPPHNTGAPAFSLKLPEIFKTSRDVRINMSVRKLSWLTAIPAVLHRSLVSSLTIRQSQPTTNQTISPDLLKVEQNLENCTSAIVLPILQFVVTNYIAHAFTIRFSPGYGPFYTILFSLKALVFPYFGLMTACRALENLALLESDPLDRAIKAGALCTVARTKEWKPEKGDEIWLP
jgi:hypothetical protein